MPLPRSVRTETLGKLCLALFIGMLLPLFIVAFYNYPADDDFFYALEAARSWTDTGSLWAALGGVWQRMTGLYQTWQGNFTHAFLVSLSPLIVDINLYFLTSWLAVAALCASLYALCRALLTRALHAGKWTFWIAYTALTVVMVQFIPSAGQGLYWHPGSVYTVSFGMELALLSGLLCAEWPAARAVSRGRNAIRTGLLAALAFLVGGCHFPIMLSCFVITLLLTARAFARKSTARPRYAACLLALIAGMIVCLSAPGNGERQAFSGEATGALPALVYSVGESLDTFGRHLTPELLAAVLLIAPALWKPLKESRFSFRYPLLVFLALYGTFASSFVPVIYATGENMGGRYGNIEYFLCVLTVLISAVYAEGWLLRRWEKRGLALPAWPGRFAAGYLALCLALTAFGGFAFTIMNTTSVCAVKAMVTGEAQRFRQEMEERADYILATDSDETEISSLQNHPYIFKEDRLPFQGVYGRLRYMKWYYELFAPKDASAQ